MGGNCICKGPEAGRLILETVMKRKERKGREEGRKEEKKKEGREMWLEYGR